MVFLAIFALELFLPMTSVATAKNVNSNLNVKIEVYSASNSKVNSIDGFNKLSAITPPKSLRVTGVNDIEVVLGWLAPDNTGGFTITGYNVYRSEKSFSVLKDAQYIGRASTASYADTAVTTGTKYYYAVTVVTSFTESGISNVVSITVTSGTQPTSYNITLILEVIAGIGVFLFLLLFIFVYLPKRRRRSSSNGKTKQENLISNNSSADKLGTMNALEFTDQNIIDSKTEKLIKKGNFPNFEIFSKAQKVGASNYEEYSLVLKYRARTFEEVKKIEEGNFPSLNDYEEAVKVGAKDYSQYELVKKYNARSYDEAKRIEQEGYPSQEVREQALKLGAKNYSQYQLIKNFNARSYDEAKKIEKGGFPSQEIYNEAVKSGLSTYSQFELVKKYNARSYNDAQKIEQGGFPSQEIYDQAGALGATTFSDYELVKKYNASSVSQAKNIQKGNFPSAEVYLKASEEDFTEYEPYRIKEERKDKLMKIMQRSTKITKEDLMSYLDISDRKIFLDWLVNLPEDSPLYLDGDSVIFKRLEASEFSLSQNIDNLLKSFDVPGREKV